MEEPGTPSLLSPARRERPRLGPAGPRSRRQTRPSNASAASAIGAREDEHARETSYGSNISDEPESIGTGLSLAETTISPAPTPVAPVFPETIAEDTSATGDLDYAPVPAPAPAPLSSSTVHSRSNDTARLSTVSSILYNPYSPANSNAQSDFQHDMQSPPAYSVTADVNSTSPSRIHTPVPSATPIPSHIPISSPSQPIVHLDEDVTIRLPLHQPPPQNPNPNPSQLHTRDLPLSPPPRMASSSPTPIATAPPTSSSLVLPPPFSSRDSYHPSPSPSPLLTISFPHQQRHSASPSPRSSSPRASTPSRNSPFPSRPSTSLSVYQPPSIASAKSSNSNSNSNSNTPKSAPIPLPPLPPLTSVEFPDLPLSGADGVGGLGGLGEDYAKYKPLTLEAAQWTLSSGELQALVSAAIRESADVRFIRCVLELFCGWNGLGFGLELFFCVLR